MRRSLNALNRPWASALALVVLLGLAGFLLFGRAEVPKDDASAPSPPTTGGGAGPAAGREEEREKAQKAPPEQGTEDGEKKAAYEDELGPFSPQRPGVEARIEECVAAEEQEPCVKDLVADAAPGAKYIGARTELNIDGSGRNQKVIYYEDPALESCEFTRKTFDSGEDTTYHSVIIAGLGAFSDKTSEGCVIEY